MGHRHDAVEALRAYVADLEPTIDDGADGRAGGAHDGDITVSGRVFGAPHFGLLTGVAGVAIVGLIGVPAAFGLLGHPAEMVTTTAGDRAGAASSSASSLAYPTGGATAERAVYVLAAAGLTDAARLVSYAIATGLDAEPEVTAAIEALLAAVADAEDASADDPAVRQATSELVEATRPPGLTVDREPPGLDGGSFVPPGQDDTFVPPGQDDTFVPPGQDDTFVPPGQDRTKPTGPDGTGPPVGTPNHRSSDPKPATGADKDVKGPVGGADT